MKNMDNERYKTYYKENSRHLESGTQEIMFRPWMHFDVVEVWAVSPHPLKSVKLGYGFWGDFKEYGDKYVKCTYSVSTEVTKGISKDGTKIIIMSYTEAVEKSKKIDWSKIKIER